MKITQVFKSLTDHRVISVMEIGGADSVTPLPVAGDDVQWVTENTTYAGRVKTRLISYSAPDRIGLERSNDIDITAVLMIQLESSSLLTD